VNDVSKIQPGKAIYSSMIDETGKVVDDITLLWVEEDYFLYNGGPLEKIVATPWLTNQAKGFKVNIIEMGLTFLAFQGPKSREILQKEADIQDIPYFGIKQTTIRGNPALIARLGFTGELGYELYSHPMFANDLWDILLEIGKDYGVAPYGYGSSTSLALEKGYLWGGDFYEGSTPLELGLGWTVAFDKDDFIGKEALLKRKDEGLKSKLVAFEVIDPEVMAAETDELLKGDKKVGAVTNAAPGPTVNKASIGRAWVDIEYANEGEELELEQGSTRATIRVSPQRDWYDPENKKTRS
jgi:aminomethyltransferase